MCCCRFLTDDEEEDFICKWRVETKERHTVAISFPQFSLQKTSGSHKGDCLKIYDGKDNIFYSLQSLFYPCTLFFIVKQNTSKCE